MIPRKPTVVDVRRYELDLLVQLEEELAQPEVREWTRWDAFLHEIARVGAVVEMRHMRRRREVA